ncbi:MAG: SIS domain-containing protein [Trueperaceae bacterium]|nr:MAG: SIS domain-containing protein [Trueperaceae bacterium]
MSSQAYFEQTLGILASIRQHETGVLQEVAVVFAEVIAADRLIHTFGTGHSSLLACEGMYRAGGLACVNAILEPTTTFETGAVAGSFFERQPGQATNLLDRYALEPGSVLVVFSNSGVNALPVEVVEEAKARGVITVAVLSRRYASQAPITSESGVGLLEVADFVIDNHVPPGDALIPFKQDAFRAGSASTVAGAFIWNALVAETVAILESDGVDAPVYISSNMPGANEHNRALVERYRGRIRHL